MGPGYSESELVKNRSALLLFGGSDADRRAWAEEAASHFEADGPLVTVTSADALPKALANPRGVVFVPDPAALGRDGQARLVHCLHLQDERPKLVIGLSTDPDEAVASGALRDDLAFRLRAHRVNLAAPGLRDALKARRAERAREEAKRPTPSPGPRVIISKPSPKPVVSARVTTVPAASAKKAAAPAVSASSAAAKKKPAKRR